jgi:predicted ATP-dependent endonuclease of OLD family
LHWRTHDIDELSSGEKEIVYGYLWLRTGTPRRSIILIDEPELHLNPAQEYALQRLASSPSAAAADPGCMKLQRR